MAASAMPLQLSPTSSSAISVRRAQAPPAKQKKTRSRNGCPQCKAKRLKCDETRPACLMCTKSGRKCPGYSQEFRWSTKHEKSLDLLPPEPSSFGNLLTAVSNVIPRDSNREDKIIDDAAEPASAQQSAQTPSPQSGTPPVPFIDHQASAAAPAPIPVPPCPELDLLSSGRGAASTMGLSTPSPETYPGDDMLHDFWDPGLTLEALGDVGLYADSLPLVTSQIARSPFGSQRDRPLRNESQVQSLFPVPWIPRTVMDRSSMLVEEWFKHVCSIWSCYDSDLNLNRKIAADAWTRSEPVMRCMQSMAATCLSCQMPQMRQVAIVSLKTAISTIKRELKAIGPHIGRGTFPSDLLLSLCCVGTAACWIDTKQLASQFLREARALIDRANREAHTLARPQDQEALSFFNNSIIYWDMLVAVVSDEEDMGLLHVDYPENGAGQIVPHPWTGISASAQRLFARAIRLCRRFRRHLRRDSISTGMALRTALRDIMEAQEIEEELLALEHRSVHEIADTGDRLTPRVHLVEIAEGYRLASLLQLYQTFPDLVVRRLPEDAIEGDVVPWDRWIVPLSLRLINTLKKVPPDSGTRCIQPLLYLSASTGLKFDVETAAVTMQQQQHQVIHSSAEDSTRKSSLSHQNGDVSGGGGGGGGNASTSSAEPDLDLALSLDSVEPAGPGSADGGIGVDDADLLQVPLTKLSIEVSHARRFVMERLSALEHSLPPAPVRVAKDLVLAVWAAYDGEKPGTNHTHWIDVMEDLDLRTIFG